MLDIDKYWASWTQPAPHKQYNEDHIGIAAKDMIFCIVDGFGSFGIAKDAGRFISDTLLSKLDGHSMDQFGSVVKIQNSVADTVVAANSKIWTRNIDSRSDEGGAAFAVIAFSMKENQLVATVASVGDVRIYKFSPAESRLELLTSDDSLAWEELYEKRRITRDEIRKNPLRNSLTRALGMLPQIFPPVKSVTVNGDDMILMCSDGFWSLFSENRIKDLISSSSSFPANVISKLKSEAENIGFYDDVSILVLGPGSKILSDITG